MVHLLHFNMQGQYYDSLTIGNGDDPSAGSSVIVRLTGTTSIRVVTSQLSVIWILIQTDDYISHLYDGFLMDLEQLQNTSGSYQEGLPQGVIFRGLSREPNGQFGNQT